MWFRSRRKELGLTLQDVAERLRVSITTVGNWDRGACQPDLSRLTDLCAVYQSDVATVLGAVGEIALRQPKSAPGRKRGAA